MTKDIKTLQALKKIRAVVGRAKRVVILLYGNPDPDGLASAWGLKEFLSTLGVSSTIYFTGQVGRLENATMMQLLKIPAEPLDEKVLKKSDCIAIVDAQPEFFKELKLPRCDIVIDHHPRKSEKSYPFLDVRSQCLATASIITDYFRVAGKTIHRRLATALYYGIETDARAQRRSPSETDSQSLRFLDRKVERNILRRIEFSQYSIKDLDYFTIALVRHRYARSVFYAHVGPVPTADVCAQVADFLIRVKEAHWALVTGVVGDKLVIVFRCDGHGKSAGDVAQAAFGKLGSAGGHRTMGRAEVSEKNLPPDVRLTRNHDVEFFVVKSLADVNPAFRPLLKNLHKRLPS